MSSFLNQQLTDVGWDALSTALGGGRLTFFKMQAGSGTILNDSDIPPMTHLVAPVCDCAITKYAIEGGGQITLWANIASAQLAAGFTFRELGIFAAIEDPVVAQGGGTPAGANIQVIGQTPEVQTNPVVPNPPLGTALMYSYCNSYDQSDYIPGSGESTDVVNTIQVTIKIDKAVQPIVNISVGQTFDVQNIGAASIGAGPWSYTQANVAYLKRLVDGPGLIITEDTNTITIGQKILTQDLDCYVAVGNPDIFPDFSTIQNALNWLRDYYIPTNIFATIHVMPGVWTNAVETIVDHPQGLQIKIEGTIGGPFTPTSASFMGGAGNGYVRLNAPAGTFSGMAVDDWFLYLNHNVLAGMMISGLQTATTVAADGSSIQFFPGSWVAYPSLAPITGANAGTVYWLKSVIKSAADQHGMTVRNQGLGLLKYLAFVGLPPTLANAKHGLNAARGVVNCEYVGAANWDVGASTQGAPTGLMATGSGNLFLSNCAANRCLDCIWAGNPGAYLSATNSFGNAAKRYGIHTDGGDASFGHCVAMGSNSVGFGCGLSSMGANNCFGCYNVAYGMYIYNNGGVANGPTAGGTYTNNGTKDISIGLVSSMSRNGTVTVYGTSNIAPNTLSADGCYFSP
jgi:hypothetical protein